MPMNNIDDQELFRKKQQELFGMFDRELLDPSKSYDENDMQKDILNYMLEQVKRDIAKRLQRMETICNFRVAFSKPELAIIALRIMYDLCVGLDDDFVRIVTEETSKFVNHEKEKKNPKSEE